MTMSPGSIQREQSLSPRTKNKKQSSLLSFAFAVFVFAICIPAIHGSYSIAIPNGDTECFSIRTLSKSQSVLSGTFDILDEDISGKKIQAILKEEHTSTVKWTSTMNRFEDFFRITVDPSKRYSLCFMSSVLPNYDADGDDGVNEKDGVEVTNIGFSYRWTNLPTRSLLEDGDKKEGAEEGPEGLRALKLVETATYIHQDWQELLDHFYFLRNREGIYVGTMNVIFKRLFRWTLIEASLVICMAIGQVLYFRRFFEQRRYL